VGVERPIITRARVGHTFASLLANNWPPGVPVFQPGLPQDGDPKAAVLVNHGRWAAFCPHCTGASLADPADHRFFCVDCLNMHVDGRVIYARWPKDWQEIEQRLLLRPDADTRNWMPGERLADLDAENIEHGLVKA